MFGFLKPKPKAQSMPEEPAPVSPLLFELEMSTVGEEYNCKKDPSMLRSYWIRQLRVGQNIRFEQYTYKKKPAICVIGNRALDVANLPEPVAGYLVGMVDQLELRGTVSNLDPLFVLVKVYGTYKNAYEFYDGAPGKRDKEYTYRLDSNKYHLIPPNTEIRCECESAKDGIAVSVGNDVIDFIDGDRGERLKRILETNDCVTTIIMDPHAYRQNIKMVLRF